MIDFCVIDSALGEPAFNMAVDETLLRAVTAMGKPVFRFYGWTERAATFGYFQKHAEVQGLTALRPLVRRPTGGGIVPHEADWTYSVAFPPSHEWYSVAAVESYRRIHAWLQAAFTEMGIPTTLAPAPLKSAMGQCFVGYEQSDLLWRGRKIAGAAQRRTRDGLLIQGSVQPPPLGLNRQSWQAMMLKSGPAGTRWENLEISGALLDTARVLQTEKYSQAAYNQKR